MAQTKIRNPFKHDHSHDHGHGHGDGHHHHHDHDHDHGDGHHHHHDEFEPTDPAQQSLADALRVSFGVLKWIMVLLLVAYLFTGIFRVSPQERAIRLRFGAIVGDPAGYGEGWHLGFPYPIEQKIMVPVTRRSVNLNNPFWVGLPPNAQAQSLDQMQGGPLNPERDGSLITGDANIVHARFSVEYQIAQPEKYVQNVGNLELADLLVRNAAEQGIVYAIAQTDADAVIRNQINRTAAVSRMQEVLDGMETGLKVLDQGFAMTQSTMPISVRPAYQSVINAESEKARLIEEARQKRTSILNEAAGEAHEPLFMLLQAYELALAANDTEKADALFAAIDQAFNDLQIQTPQGGLVSIGGQASQTISQAQTDRVATVQQVRQEANTFRSLLELYRKSPELVRTQLWQAAREAIFTGDVETIYADTGNTVTITTNRDPAIGREREAQRLRAEQEAARQQPPQ